MRVKASEWGWGLLLLVLGVGTRLFFVSLFPTLPISDFRGIVDFAVALRDQSLFVSGYYWDVFNLGPPLALSLVLRVFRENPEAVSRFATAVWCGSMPLLPYFLWRRVLPLWVRIAAGAMLAVWPGQVLFSGVVAQDNWVIVPAVAMGCLAARVLLDPERRIHPFAAGLVYAFSVSMRQEMLGALFPCLLAAAGLTGREGWRPKNVLACALAVGLPFLALAAQRQKATGHFALASGHAGFTLLGSVVPGATHLYWKDPVSYIASVEPGLARDRHRMFAEAGRLAAAEVKRRPGFQALRVTAFAMRLPFVSDAELLYWSTAAPGTLPEPLQKRGEAFARNARIPLRLEMAGIHALFLTALGLGLARRNRAILVLALAVLLKIGVHAALSAGGRFFVPATALEILAGALGLWEASRLRLRIAAVAYACGAAVSVALVFAGAALYSHVRRLDPDDEQRTYRFVLTSYQHPGALEYTVTQGRLAALGDIEAALELIHIDPKPGEKVLADCVLRQTGPPLTLAVELLDGYALGGLPGRILQKVEIDGREAVSHDLADEPWSGWLKIPAGTVGPGTERKIRIEISAIAPDPGLSWGLAAGTRLRLAP